MTLQGPVPIEDLDRLSMWIKPVQGDGKCDDRLFTSKEEWSNLGMTEGRWNELDSFDLTYEKYCDNTSVSKTFED